MSQNITLLGASYSDVPAVTLPKTGGGTARFTDTTVTTAVESDVASGKTFIKADGSIATGTSSGGGGGSITQDQDGYLVLSPNGGGGGGGGDTWAWYGINAELLKSESDTIALEDTDYATWTPSTSSSVIYTLPSSGNITTDFSTYDYTATLEFVFNPVYETGTTLQNAVLRNVYAGKQDRGSTPSSYSQLENGSGFTNQTSDTCGYNMCIYVNSSGTPYIGQSNAAVYCNTFSAANSGTSYFYIQPKVYAVCSSSYFSTTMAAAIDQENSTFSYRYCIYRIPKNRGILRGVVDVAVNNYHNGIS